MKKPRRQALAAIACELVAEGKGILAADESSKTMTKRLLAVGAESTPESRRRFRELLITTPDAEARISGVILYDETIRQLASDGTTFPQLLSSSGMLTGIKVDTGAKALAEADGETITEGLDGLRERLHEYHELGARFAKWRAVVTIGDGLPSRYCLAANAHALGRYAALCQEAGIVPIVEPEVLMDGDHSIERSEEVTREVLRAVFAELLDQRVLLEGMVLKPNMIMAAYSSERQAGVEEVAARTLAVLREVVPAAVPGIAFLSGGQSDELASAHLNALNAGDAPWQLTFSYGRALQAVPLKIWAGEEGNVSAAQTAFAHRVHCTGEARAGRYSAALEHELAVA
jgi:fructose-bisphosphate aldolase, class I